MEPEEPTLYQHLERQLGNYRTALELEQGLAAILSSGDLANLKANTAEKKKILQAITEAHAALEPMLREQRGDNGTLADADCEKLRGEAVSLLPLNMVETGAKVKVERFAGGGNFQRRIQDMGLKVGQTVTILRAGGDGPCVVAAGESRIGVGAGMAKKIMVRIQEQGKAINGKS